jgi:ECF sigma factor
MRDVLLWSGHADPGESRRRDAEDEPRARAERCSAAALVSVSTGRIGVRPTSARNAIKPTVRHRLSVSESISDRRLSQLFSPIGRTVELRPLNLMVISWPAESRMSTASRSNVTTLLHAWSNGDETARDKLWAIVFPELNRLAHRHMRKERPDHTLQTGALVNEAYMRLVDWKKARWQNRAHFFGMCARIMRQILVDHARTHSYQQDQCQTWPKWGW